MQHLGHQFAALLAVLGIWAGTATSSAQTRVGVIDVKKVFDSYWKTKQADASLRERGRQLDQTRQRMLEDYKKAAADYKALSDSVNDPVLSATERNRRKQNAERKLAELRELEQSTEQFDLQSRNQLSEQQRIAREGIFREIRERVTAKARLRGFTMVLDTAAETINQTPMMVYTNGDNDLTNEILAEMNGGASAPAPASTPTPFRFPPATPTPAPAPSQPPFQPETFRK